MLMLKRMVALLFAAPLLATAAGSVGAETVYFIGLKAEVPEHWQAERPGSNMRLLQYSVPGEKGGEGAQFILYYFGFGQGGNLMDNMERWQSQFSNPDGTAVEPLVSEIEEAALPAVLVELRGSYARGVGMGPVGEALPDRMLLAGLVESPKGNLYPQLHGPAAFVGGQRDAFIAFIRSIVQDPGKVAALSE